MQLNKYEIFYCMTEQSARQIRLIHIRHGHKKGGAKPQSGAQEYCEQIVINSLDCDDIKFTFDV